MDEYDVVIGGRPLTLRKSDQFVALRAAAATTIPQLEAATEAAGAQLLGQRLGGFELVRTGSAGGNTESALETMRASAGVDAGTHVFHTSGDDVPFVPTGTLFIVFKPETPPEAANALLDQYGLEVVRNYGPLELIARVTRGSRNPVHIASELAGNEYLEVAEPNLATPARLAGFALPNEPLLAQQWHLRNTGTVNGSAVGLKAGADAGVVDAWAHAQSLGTPDIIVAVIDDGFDLSHPDFGGAAKVVAPWDFTRNSSDVSPEYSAEYPFFKNGAWNGDWHGTACAGVAVASAQGSGVVGAAPGCRLLPIRWGPSLDPEEVVRWFDYAADSGAAVISCSWKATAAKYRLPEFIGRALTRCACQGRGGRGCVIVFAAGNDASDILSPDGRYENGFALHPEVIAVSASTSRDELANYSNYGNAVAVCAPSSGAGGRGITTADVTGSFTRGSTRIGSGYAAGAYTHDFGGTSSSTPLVAGICALLLSLRPGLSAPEVKALICRTARPIGDQQGYQDGHSVHFGHGCIDAAAAVADLLGSPAPARARAAAVQEG